MSSDLAQGAGRLLALTALVMLAFAANSLLNRFALADAAMGPSSFALARGASAFLTLLLLLGFREAKVPRFAWPRPLGVLGLSAYLICFSYAYLTLDAGVGALLLFGVVQLVLFGSAWWQGSAPGLTRWAGMGLALFGLVLLTWPGAGFRLDPLALLLMGVAALGWGFYTLVGTRSSDALASTTWSFGLSLLPLLVVFLFLGRGEIFSFPGLGWALLSGALTSGMAYALWYALLPSLGASRAALAQLSVPVIALALGVLLLGEAVSMDALLACLLILGGIGLGLLPARHPKP